MRISTFQTFNRGIADIQRVSNAGNTTQEQISTGRRVLRPSDDPVAATRILQLNREIAAREQYQQYYVGDESAIARGLRFCRGLVKSCRG